MMNQQWNRKWIWQSGHKIEPERERERDRERDGQRSWYWERVGGISWEIDTKLKGIPRQIHLPCFLPAPLCCLLNGWFPNRLHHSLGVCRGVFFSSAGCPALKTEAWCVSAPLPPPFDSLSFLAPVLLYPLRLSLLLSPLLLYWHEASWVSSFWYGHF